MATKFLNQSQLTGTVTPVNSIIATGDNGMVVAQKLQGQINAGNLTINVQTFTTSGTYTPTTGMKYCIIECVGGGGAGGGYSLVISVPDSTQEVPQAGGGSGGYSSKYATAATIGASQTVTIGTGGAGTTGAGNNGTATSVGTICVANGGYGSSSAGTGGAGASIGTGDVTLTGYCGYNCTARIPIISGQGASSIFGCGGLGIFSVVGSYIASDGNNGVGYGSGGSGVYANTTYKGGNGAPGYCIITEYI